MVSASVNSNLLISYILVHVYACAYELYKYTSTELYCNKNKLYFLTHYEIKGNLKVL